MRSSLDQQIKYPEGSRPFDVSPESVLELWHKVKDKEILFSDEDRGNYYSFLRALTESFVLCNDYGIIRISKMIPLHRCEIHGFVLGTSASRFRDTVLSCISWLFEEYKMKRVECRVPARARALRRFLEKIGFKEEGILRNKLLYSGVPEDEIIYAIIRR